MENVMSLVFRIPFLVIRDKSRWGPNTPSLHILHPPCISKSHSRVVHLCASIIFATLRPLQHNFFRSCRHWPCSRNTGPFSFWYPPQYCQSGQSKNFRWYGYLMSCALWRDSRRKWSSKGPQKMSRKIPSVRFLVFLVCLIYARTAGRKRKVDTIKERVRLIHGM